MLKRHSGYPSCEEVCMAFKNYEQSSKGDKAKVSCKKPDSQSSKNKAVATNNIIRAGE